MEDMIFIIFDLVKDLLNKVIGIGMEGIVDLIKEYDCIC